nr:MAG TPA: hypothetical protein [Caudoviricetes sp.]
MSDFDFYLFLNNSLPIFKIAIQGVYSNYS